MKLQSLVVMMIVLVAAASQPVGAQSPTAVITPISTTGQAPFTVHVHGLATTLGQGTPETALYLWDFVDPTTALEPLIPEGWNHAHTYGTPGRHLLKFRVYNELGNASNAEIEIVVTASTRTVYYVSPTGSDSNDGLTELTPIQTVAKVQTLMGSNKEFRFKRGGTFNVNSPLDINSTNVVLTAYGSGSTPILYWPSSANTTAGIVRALGSSSRVTIERIKFDSGATVLSNASVLGIYLQGSETTVRYCEFGKVSYAMNSAGFGAGLLTQGNIAGTIGAYYCWVDGSDHVHRKNTVGNSVDEHIIRGAPERILIADNDLQNDGKSTIWMMDGTYAYIARNVLREGRILIGPNFDQDPPDPDARMQHVVVDANHVIEEGFIAYAGAEDVWYRNNVIENDGGPEVFSIWGYDEDNDRTTKRIHVHNNTAINLVTQSIQYGTFINVGVGAEDFKAANNMNDAPFFNPYWPTGQMLNVRIQDCDLSEADFRYNLWALPAMDDEVHSVCNALVTVAQWDAYPQTTGEMYRDFSTSDLNGLFIPQFDANVGVAVAGVHLDFYRHWRPLTGTVTVGAVQD